MSLAEFPERQVEGGNGGSFDARLRAVEGDIREIKAKLENFATKRDIDKLKIWALIGTLVGSFGAITFLVRALGQQ